MSDSYEPVLGLLSSSITENPKYNGYNTEIFYNIDILFVTGNTYAIKEELKKIGCNFLERTFTPVSFKDGDIIIDDLTFIKKSVWLYRLERGNDDYSIFERLKEAYKKLEKYIDGVLWVKESNNIDLDKDKEDYFRGWITQSAFKRASEAKFDNFIIQVRKLARRNSVETKSIECKRSMDKNFKRYVL